MRNGKEQEYQPNINTYLYPLAGVTLPPDLGSLAMVRDKGVFLSSSARYAPEKLLPLHAVQVVSRPRVEVGTYPYDVEMFSVTQEGQFVGARYSEKKDFGFTLQSLSVSGYDYWFPEPAGEISRGTASNPLQGYIQSISNRERTGERTDPRISKEATTLFGPHIIEATGHTKLLTVHFQPHIDALAMIGWPGTRKGASVAFPTQMVAKLNEYLSGKVTCEHLGADSLVAVNSDYFSVSVPAILPRLS